jgi:hypothetical protein
MKRLRMCGILPLFPPMPRELVEKQLRLSHLFLLEICVPTVYTVSRMLFRPTILWAVIPAILRCGAMRMRNCKVASSFPFRLGNEVDLYRVISDQPRYLRLWALSFSRQSDVISYRCTGRFKKMGPISYNYISRTIHLMWMIYIIFERGGSIVSNTTAIALN